MTNKEKIEDIKSTINWLLENGQFKDTETAYNIAMNSINIAEEAINYAHSSTQLKGKYTQEFEEWVKTVGYDNKINLYIMNNGYYTKEMLFDIWKLDEQNL